MLEETEMKGGQIQEWPGKRAFPSLLLALREAGGMSAYCRMQKPSSIFYTGKDLTQGVRCSEKYRKG